MHIVSDGNKLTVREVSEPIVELRSWGVGNGPPLPIINTIVSKDRARSILKDVLPGDYNRIK